MKRVAVVGGGIAGLAAAHAIRARASAADLPIDIVVLEKSARPGGNIRTERVDGYVCEVGPNGFLDSVPGTLQLVDALGLRSRLQPSNDAARRRFIFRNGTLHQLPGSPREFLSSGLLSWAGKLRIATEPLARRRPEGDETIYAFAARRIGSEAADVLIDSMVSGIFAGDARELSLRACFPRMWQLESDYGGLFRAMLALQMKKRRERRGSGAARAQRTGDAMGTPAGRLTSFVGGMEDLICGLRESLAGLIRINTPVTAVHEIGRPSTGRRYRLFAHRAGPLDADAVILTGPAREAAELLSDVTPVAAQPLCEIPTAPLAVVCLGYGEDTVSRARGPLDGFGYLIPRSEGIRTLGVLWDSSIYPGRAPDGHVLLRAMIGGARDPEAAELPDQQLLRIILDDLRATMQLDVLPEFVRIYRHRIGIPQYTRGHLQRLEAIEATLALHPGLFVTGNSYKGVAINSCIAEARPLAERVIGHLSVGR